MLQAAEINNPGQATMPKAPVGRFFSRLWRSHSWTCNSLFLVCRVEHRRLVIYEMCQTSSGLVCQKRIAVAAAESVGLDRLPDAETINTCLGEHGISCQQVFFFLQPFSVRHAMLSFPAATTSEEESIAELQADERFGDTLEDHQICLQKISTSESETAKYLVSVVAGDVLDEIRTLCQQLKWNCEAILPPESASISLLEHGVDPSELTCIVQCSGNRFTFAAFAGARLIAGCARVLPNTSLEQRSHFCIGELRRIYLTLRTQLESFEQATFVLVGNTDSMGELQTVIQHEFQGTMLCIQPDEMLLPGDPAESDTTDVEESQWLNTISSYLLKPYLCRIDFLQKWKHDNFRVRRKKFLLAGVALLILPLALLGLRKDSSAEQLKAELAVIRCEQLQLNEELAALVEEQEQADRWLTWKQDHVYSRSLLNDVVRTFPGDKSVYLDEIRWSRSADEEVGPTVVVSGAATNTDVLFMISDQLNAESDFSYRDLEMDFDARQSKYPVRFHFYLRWCRPATPNTAEHLAATDAEDPLRPLDQIRSSDGGAESL